MNPSLDIVIVNWNSGEQLRACLQSIARTDRAEFDLRRVVVVDNASRDGSADDLSAVLPLQIVRNVENRGFGAACNQGVRGTDAEYVLFLNPDTVLHSKSLSVPVGFMADPCNRSVGICGIALEDESGVVARSCSRFPTTPMFLSKMLGLSAILPAEWARQRMTDWDHASSRDVDQVIGAFFLVRRTLFEELGGFDERFFVYFEEVDFSLRAARRGFRTRFLASARAMHRGGGCSYQVKARRLAYSVRSRLEYGMKNFSRASAALLIFSTLVIEPIARVVLALVRGSLADCGETLRGFRDVWRIAPSLLGRTARLTRDGAP